jgi:hypothetical protein
MSIRRIAKWPIGLLAVGNVAMCTWFYMFQEYVLFAPNTDPTDLPTKRRDRKRIGPEFRQDWFNQLATGSDQFGASATAMRWRASSMHRDGPG